MRGGVFDGVVRGAAKCGNRGSPMARPRSATTSATHCAAEIPPARARAGARSYNYRTLEVRDSATGFKPLTGTGTSATRNDVMFMAGVRFSRHHTSGR